MDFTLEETQQAVARLAADVLDHGRPAAAPSPVPAAGDADGYDSAARRATACWVSSSVKSTQFPDSFRGALVRSGAGRLRHAKLEHVLPAGGQGWRPDQARSRW